MESLDFYDEGALRRLATNLFYGWGYNFYKVENQLRADDQLVRAKAGWLLGVAAASVAAAEGEYRREFLPPPSRAKPFPDASAVAGARRLEQLVQAIRRIASRLADLPAPENDRMSQRFRREAATLAALNAIDEQLVGQCELLRLTVCRQDGAAQDATWIIANHEAIAGGLAAIEATLLKREAELLSKIP